MKASRFREEQIVGMIKEQEARLPTANVCRKLGPSSEVLQVQGQVRRHGCQRGSAVEVLEDENVRRKKLLAAAMLDNAMLKKLSKKLVAPALRREAVAYL